MKKLKLSLIISIISVNLFFSQSYSSTFEKEIFNSFKKDTLNYDFFKSLFAIDSTLTKEKVNQYRSSVLSLLSNLPPKEEKEKKEKKRVKLIYDKIHEKFFKKYVLDSYFTDIFNNGRYNCVTASALYAFAFDELKIPYYVKQTPSHVFLVAYPKSHKIYLETTVPGAHGFVVPEESEVKKIINELIAYKLVTQEEVNSKGYIKFYEDYYYGKDFISKNSLIGMQYYNKGIFDFQNSNYNQAINNLRKAKVFYSSPIIKSILKSIMFLKINDLEFNSENDVDFLLELLSISKYPEDFSISNLKSSLFKIIEHDDNDDAFIEKTIDNFKILEHKKVRHEAITFLYEYLAKNAARDEDLDKALGYSDNILKIKPKSKVAKQIVEYVCFRKVLLSTFDIKTLKSFEANCEKYPFLKENKRYYISLVHLYANISILNFKNKEIIKGKNYLSKIENILDNRDILNEVNKHLISSLYLRAGNYYYYKEQHKASYDIYMKGLTYLPKNSELTKKAKWSKDEL